MLYWQPKSDVPTNSSDPWYTCQSVGKHKLSAMVSSMCSEAGIDQRKTYHSLRVSGATSFVHQMLLYTTGELQPLDLTVNQVFKQELKACFIKWYAGLVKEQLRDGVELENTKADLRTSILRPLQAHWLIEAISKIISDMVVEGFVKSGINIS